MPEFIDDLEEYETSIEFADLHLYDSTNFDHLTLSGMKIKRLGGEKRISVDPISLQDAVSKPKFLSYSLPNSANSSPRFGSSMSKKKLGNLSQAPALRVNPFYRQDYIALANLERLRESHTRRSKSCGEGRASAPPEEFDLWLMKTNNNHPGKISHPKAEIKVVETKINETMEIYDEKFKCGALCLFLPGLVGKTKPIKARKEEPEPEPEILVQSKEPEIAGQNHVVSKRVSLEKFECGSWRSSSTILNDNEADKDASNLFYDLPLEMIRRSVSSDTHSPVTAAFVFDKDRKGVLKKSSSRTTTPKKSPDSSRHVRFSTSSPTSHSTSPTSCVTPRLLKTREDFNAFLEAQTA